MGARHDIALIVKIAQMYYNDEMRQDEIAEKMKISRSFVSMLLTEAKDLGIVEVHIRNPLINDDVTSSRIKEFFNLPNCIVVPTSVKDKNVLRLLIAERTISLLNELLTNDFNIGIVWGRTCFEFVTSYVPNKKYKNINIVPLVGGSNQNAKYFQLNEMIRQFASKLEGIPNFIHAPAFVGSKEEKELIMNSTSMKEITKKWKSIDVMISGIGSLYSAMSNEREAFLGENKTYNPTEDNMAIGDICARYFKKDGEFIVDDYYDRFIGIPLEDMKKIKNIICMASGEEKVNSITGALRTGIINTLVIDSQTANQVLDVYDKK